MRQRRETSSPRDSPDLKCGCQLRTFNLSFNITFYDFSYTTLEPQRSTVESSGSGVGLRTLD